MRGGAGVRGAVGVLAGAVLLLTPACSDDTGDAPRPAEESGPTAEATGTAHSDAALVEALPSAPAERHGLAVFESCIDFDTPGNCLGQEAGTVVLNLSDGMNQGLLLTVAREHTDESFEERGDSCPDGAIDDPAQELESGEEIPGRQGTGERTPWEHGGWSGWVCRADYTQSDSAGGPADSYSLTLLLATDGHHQLSVRTAAEVDVELWAREYVDRLD